MFILAIGVEKQKRKMMINRIQIIGNKVYYNMECVAILNELNYTTNFLEFKQMLLKINKERNENENDK